MARPAPSHSRDLTDEQWVLIGPVLPKLARRADGRGRPWRENRAVLNGILWILRTGAPWADLPDRVSLLSNVPSAVQRWVRAGVLRTVLGILAQALHDEGYLNLQEAFIDGSFAPAKRGGTYVGKTKRGKGSKIMAIADRQGRPVAVHLESAPRRMKSPWFTPRSRSYLSASSQRVSSATTPTSRTDWMPNWRAMAWN
jgi:transposase